MRYTKIEGVLLVSVISKILLPMVDFTIFGSSLHFAVEVDSATTAIIASGLVAIAIPESPKYVEYASMITLLAATSFLSRCLLQLDFFSLISPLTQSNRIPPRCNLLRDQAPKRTCGFIITSEAY